MTLIVVRWLLIVVVVYSFDMAINRDGNPLSPPYLRLKIRQTDGNLHSSKAIKKEIPIKENEKELFKTIA